MQLIAQILINRISLLMIDRRKVARFKWGTALALTVICISVFIVWIPAHLQISPMFILFNNVWDRIEKVLILIPDAGLNIYFLWLVKSTLIDYGLTKYTTLFRFNLVAVFVSVSLDVRRPEPSSISAQQPWRARDLTCPTNRLLNLREHL